ncbi:MAG: hypothetical protein J6T67_05930 [Paludibacteraceae bacterium]|nr:hypothetical protein [Paludibacteraceae bacterium]
MVWRGKDEGESSVALETYPTFIFGRMMAMAPCGLPPFTRLVVSLI